MRASGVVWPQAPKCPESTLNAARGTRSKVNMVHRVDTGLIMDSWFWCCGPHRRTRSSRSLRPGHFSSAGPEPAHQTESCRDFYQHRVLLKLLMNTADLLVRQQNSPDENVTWRSDVTGSLENLTSALMYFYSCQTEHDSHGRSFCLWPHSAASM